MRGLIKSGADLMTNMYDIRIWFPGATGTPAASEFSAYPLTVRAKGFEIKDVEIETYDISYHGIKIKRPKTSMVFDRVFDIEFREDAALDLRRKFSAWHMAVADPVTGGVSNATSFFGRVQVGTIVGEYYATTVAPPGNASTTGIESKSGWLTSDINPIAIWDFYGVWVTKITGAKFNTEAADPGSITVSFAFVDCDFPQYGGNQLTAGGNDWTSPEGAAS
jgi:hypothetical protein